MKSALAVITAVSFLCLGSAKADLVYLEEFNGAADRSSLMIRFTGDTGPDGKMTMELSFGTGINSRTANIKFKPISDAKRFHDAMDELLKALNDPQKTSISVRAAMSDAGWDMSK